jgi:hypothetical protein
MYLSSNLATQHKVNGLNGQWVECDWDFGPLCIALPGMILAVRNTRLAGILLLIALKKPVELM